MKPPPKYWTGLPLLMLGLPWLTPGAIDALSNIIKKHFRVLEFGAGGSTLFFAARCRSVISWEPDPAWRKEIVKRLGDRTNHWITGDLEAVFRQKKQFEIVLVDNEDKRGRREVIARRAIPYVAAGGWFILDNYARYNTDFLAGWNCSKYDDPHWSGRGTLIATFH